MEICKPVSFSHRKRREDLSDFIQVINLDCSLNNSCLSKIGILMINWWMFVSWHYMKERSDSNSYFFQCHIRTTILFKDTRVLVNFNSLSWSSQIKIIHVILNSKCWSFLALTNNNAFSENTLVKILWFFNFLFKKSEILLERETLCTP